MKKTEVHGIGNRKGHDLVSPPLPQVPQGPRTTLRTTALGKGVEYTSRRSLNGPTSRKGGHCRRPSGEQGLVIVHASRWHKAGSLLRPSVGEDGGGRTHQFLWEILLDALWQLQLKMGAHYDPTVPVQPLSVGARGAAPRSHLPSASLWVRGFLGGSCAP